MQSVESPSGINRHFLCLAAVAVQVVQFDV